MRLLSLCMVALAMIGSACVKRHQGEPCPPGVMDETCEPIMCPAGQRVSMSGTCVPMGQCDPGQHDGGNGTCVEMGTCSEGFHDGGDGACVREGTCSVDFFDDGEGLCINDTNSCAQGFHDDGTRHACVRMGRCATGFHQGGDGVCVPDGMCSAGYHDGGRGSCLPLGECASGFHDGGDGTCLTLDRCSMGYFADGAGACVNDTASCAQGFHDGGGNRSCVRDGMCSSGYMLDTTTGNCVGDGSGGGDGGVPEVPPCCDDPPATDPCGMAGSACGLGQRSMVQLAANGRAAESVQVRVDLPVAWVGTSLRMDCSDLVFREMDGTWAPHWVEECAPMAGGGPRVWVRIRRLDPQAGATLAVHHGGPSVAAAQSFDRVFDRVPSRDPALLGAWTFDEGMGNATRHAGPPAFFWWAMPGSTDPAVPVPRTSPLNGAIWAPQGGHWGTRRDVKFTRGSAFRTVDRTTLRVPAMQTPRPDQGFTMAAWFRTDTTPNMAGVDWATIVSLGAPEGWGNNTGVDIFNPYALFLYQNMPDSIGLQGNTCHRTCLMVGDYNHISTRREFMDREITRMWHFLAMTYNFQTGERHIYFDGVDEPILMCMDGMRICDRFLETPISGGPMTFTPAPMTIGSDLNNGVDGLTLNGDIDDVFILNRAATVDELQAFMERRFPIPLPTATVQ